MAHGKIAVMVTISLILSQVELIFATTEKFVCVFQLQSTSQSNVPISAVQYGISSHLVCGTLCTNTPYYCAAFHFTHNACYLYGDVTPPDLPEGTICQITSSAPTTASTALLTQRSTPPNVTSQTAVINTIASVTVIINGVSYPSLSCYPQKLFPEVSYIPKIPIAGKEADCKCEGGLYIQDGTYVNQSATTFADCFSACEKSASPPCKAFAFMEANNTCIIAPTNSNGDNIDKGILQCYI